MRNDPGASPTPPSPEQVVGGFTLGQSVEYVNDEDRLYPVRLRATIFGEVEGWIEIEMSDGSTAIVRPSRVRALTKSHSTDIPDTEEE